MASILDCPNCVAFIIDAAVYFVLAGMYLVQVLNDHWWAKPASVPGLGVATHAGYLGISVFQGLSAIAIILDSGFASSSEDDILYRYALNTIFVVLADFFAFSLVLYTLFKTMSATASTVSAFAGSAVKTQLFRKLKVIRVCFALFSFFFFPMVWSNFFRYETHRLCTQCCAC